MPQQQRKQSKIRKEQRRSLDSSSRQQNEEQLEKCSHASDSYNYIKAQKELDQRTMDSAQWRRGREKGEERAVRQKQDQYNNDVVLGLYIILHFL